MKITIEGDAKEIAALLGTERLDSKLADVKKEIIGEIADAIAMSTACHIKPLQEHGTETPCQARY